MPTLVSPAIDAGSFFRGSQPSIRVDEGAALRPWLTTDAAAVADVYADPDIQRWHVRTAQSVEEARQWIVDWQGGWADQSQLHWALVDISADTLLGRTALKGIDLRDGTAGLAYWMAPRARGRGLCTQAVIALCHWAFDAGFHRIEIEHSTANPASCRVAAKAGFRAEGIRRGAALHADGWHDMHFHGLLADDVGH